MALSVVIPSRKIGNLEVCLAALKENEPFVNIIVIDDGLEGHVNGDNVRVVPGKKPFIFARNCNIGINSAGRENVILLNDDAILKTPFGLHKMQRQWADHPEYGIIGSSMDDCGTPNQIRKGDSGLREEMIMLVFACVFIPRVTIDRIGLLDERFCVHAGGGGIRGYGCDDDDYSWRVREAGLKLGVSDSCFIDHSTLLSTFRARDSKVPQADVRLHEKVFMEKWGKHPHAKHS